jgi:hypothetical protein
MAESLPKFHAAMSKDVDAVLRMMSAYYAEDGCPFSAHEAREQLNHFLASPELGSLWVAESVEDVVGYLVVTLGSSLCADADTRPMRSPKLGSATPIGSPASGRDSACRSLAPGGMRRLAMVGIVRANAG